MVKESASKINRNNTQMILVNRGSRHGNLEGLISLSYTPIKAYCTAVLGCSRDWLRVYAVDRFGIRYCAIGWFQIVMFRMASVSLSDRSEDWVSRVQRVSSVGVADESSLTCISMGAEAVFQGAVLGLIVPLFILFLLF